MGKSVYDSNNASYLAIVDDNIKLLSSMVKINDVELLNKLDRGLYNGTLKQFGKDIGGINNSNKGVFPYDAINTDNYDEVLSKCEPFEHKNFFSSLGQNNLLTDDEYKQYIDDEKRFANR